jgi:DNA-binding transcriptional ArsR family regulator
MSRILDKISKPERDGDRVYKGFNFFSYDDRDLLFALVRGEHVITGFRHTDIQRQLSRLSSSHISRHLKRLRVHGLIKRIGQTKGFSSPKARTSIVGSARTGQRTRWLRPCVPVSVPVGRGRDGSSP